MFVVIQTALTSFGQLRQTAVLLSIVLSVYCNALLQLFMYMYILRYAGGSKVLYIHVYISHSLGVVCNSSTLVLGSQLFWASSC